MNLFCHKCQKLVETYKFSGDIGISVISSYYCDECKSFIESKMEKQYTIKFGPNGVEREEIPEPKKES
jgi:hypothetical protein